MKGTGILKLQRKFRELGRLRMGTTTPSSKGKPRPVKLSTWRLTSHSRDLLEAAAGMWGGEVKEWANAPTDGDNFELITKTATLPIIVPPGEVLSQAYELWTGGGCQRRCGGPSEDGDARQWDRDVPCACPFDNTERMELAQKGKACKITTRLSVMLPDVPDIGVWRLESHGYNAASELAGTYDLCRLSTAKGVPIAARLTIQHREVKRPGQPPKQFTVPIIEIDEKIGEVVESIGRASLPAAERRSLPAAQPLQESGVAPGGNGGERFPSPPPVPSEGGVVEAEIVDEDEADPDNLPRWLLDIDAPDDGSIVDAANVVAAKAAPEGAEAPVMVTLYDVARLAVSRESQKAIVARVKEQAEEPVQDPLT